MSDHSKQKSSKENPVEKIDQPSPEKIAGGTPSGKPTSKLPLGKDAAKEGCPPAKEAGGGKNAKKTPTVDPNQGSGKEEKSAGKAAKQKAPEQAPEQAPDQSVDGSSDGTSDECLEPIKDTSPVRIDHEIRGMLLTIRAETKMTFVAIIKAALRAWSDKLAFARPMYFRRLSRQSLRIMAGTAAEVEKAIDKSIMKIMRTRINPALKVEVIAEIQNEGNEWKQLRQLMYREAGIPISTTLSTDLDLAIGTLQMEKEASPIKQVQNSYENIIRLLERYRLETFEDPEDPNNPLSPDDFE